jgi:hypothetical protein
VSLCATEALITPNATPTGVVGAVMRCASTSAPVMDLLVVELDPVIDTAEIANSRSGSRPVPVWRAVDGSLGFVVSRLVHGDEALIVYQRSNATRRALTARGAHSWLGSRESPIVGPVDAYYDV